MASIGNVPPEGGLLRTNYVLIDFENVHPECLAPLAPDHFKVIVFVGAKQERVPFGIAAALQRLGGRGEYVKIAGNGPNALDFHIAYYIGHLSSIEPDAYFHVISRDTGFDPLIEHLRTKKILASRSNDIDSIPRIKAANVMSADERLRFVMDSLEKAKAARPRTVRTLTSTIASLFQKRIAEKEIANLISSLEAKGVVAIDGAHVRYVAADGQLALA